MLAASYGHRLRSQAMICFDSRKLVLRIFEELCNCYQQKSVFFKRSEDCGTSFTPVVTREKILVNQCVKVART